MKEEKEGKERREERRIEQHAHGGTRERERERERDEREQGGKEGGRTREGRRIKEEKTTRVVFLYYIPSLLLWLGDGRLETLKINSVNATSTSFSLSLSLFYTLSLSFFLSFFLFLRPDPLPTLWYPPLLLKSFLYAPQFSIYSQMAKLSGACERPRCQEPADVATWRMPNGGRDKRTRAQTFQKINTLVNRLLFFFGAFSSSQRRFSTPRPQFRPSSNKVFQHCVRAHSSALYACKMIAVKPVKEKSASLKLINVDLRLYISGTSAEFIARLGVYSRFPSLAALIILGEILGKDRYYIKANFAGV